MTQLVNTLSVYPRARALVWEVGDPSWGISSQRGGGWARSHADLGSDLLASVIPDESSSSPRLRLRVVVSVLSYCCVGQMRRQVLCWSQAVQGQDGAAVLGGAGVGGVSLSPSGSQEPPLSSWSQVSTFCPWRAYRPVCGVWNFP